MTKTVAQSFGQATYKIARNGNHAIIPLKNCPLMKLGQAETYASDMILAGFDVVVINMAGV